MRAFAFFTLLGILFSFEASFGQAYTTCSYTDRGWEEHWGGHRSCGECTQKHGRCVESCSINYYKCEARGVDAAGGAVTLKGNGQNRWDAERNALKYCQRYFNNCSVTSCNTQNEPLFSRECPQENPPQPPRPPEPKPEPGPGHGGGGGGGEPGRGNDPGRRGPGGPGPGPRPRP